MSRTKTLLRSLIAIGAAGALAAFGTFSAFSDTTENPGNQITAGTVELSDNDVNGAIYDWTGAKPGAANAIEKCITVSYDGDLASDVKLYIPEAVGALAQYVNLKIEAGTDPTPTFGACGGDFTPVAAPALWDGTLQGFRAAHNGWTGGKDTTPAGETEWTNGDTVTYRVRVEIQDTNAAQGLNTGTHRLVWEARNT